MNTNNNQYFKASSKGSIKKNNSNAGETIALGTQSEKAFTAADFWNIQRRSKTLLQRRRFA